MCEAGVPQTLPSATAAIIAGVSEATFRTRYTQPGLVKIVLVCARGVLVSTASLEAAIGREITCKMYCIAERQRDGRREYARGRRASLNAGVLS